MTELILVSDFDGTLYRGDGPVRHYARLLAAQLDPAEAEPYLASFERYLAHGPAAAAGCADLVEAAALRESVDAWGAAVQLGRRVYGVGGDAVGEAFAETRAHMVEVDLDLEPVTGLIDVYRQLRGKVRLLLATNSPLPGMDVLLGRLGAADLFDEVVGGVGKPDGLRRRLAVGPTGERSPGELRSVGRSLIRGGCCPSATTGATRSNRRLKSARSPDTLTGSAEPTDRPV